MKSKKAQKKPAKKNDDKKLMKEVIAKLGKEKQNLEDNVLTKNNVIDRTNCILTAIKKVIWPEDYRNEYQTGDRHSDEQIIGAVAKIQAELDEKTKQLHELTDKHWYMFRLAMKDENLQKDLAAKNINQQNFYS